MTARYRAVDHALYPLGRDRALCVCADGTRALLSAAEAEALRRCDRFRPLDEPALRDRGLLVEHGAYAELLGGGPDPASNQPQALVAIPTAGRPQGLVRAIESYVASARRHGHGVRFVIADDAASPDARRETRARLAQLAARDAIEIRYIDLERKVRFARTLIAAKVAPADVVKFALFDSLRTGLVPYGANRNAMLLATAGERVLSADDDTVARGVAAPGRDAGVRLFRGEIGEHEDPREHWFFPSIDEATAGLGLDVDVLGGIGRVLGRPLGALFAEAGGPLDLDRGRASFAGGRVAVVSIGIAGDSGYGSGWDLLMADSWLDRLTASEDSYAMGTTSRQVVRVAQRLAISDKLDNLPGTIMAFDNRELLPPCPPIGIGEDHLFGALVGRVVPRALFAYVPFALGHLPVQARRDPPGNMARGYAAGSWFLLAQALVARAPARAADTRARLDQVGRYLEDLGSAPPARFRDEVTSVVLEQLAQRIAWLEQQLPRRPAFFARDVEAFIASSVREAARPEGWLPIDLLYGRTPADCAVLTAALIRMYGRLLRHWPELRQAGDGLAVDVTS